MLLMAILTRESFSISMTTNLKTMHTQPLNLPKRKPWKGNEKKTHRQLPLKPRLIKAEGSGSRGRIRQADFDELTRSIIEETISIYRAQIGSIEPFPEQADDRNTVKQAWLEVCTTQNLRVELEEDIFKLVSN